MTKACDAAPKRCYNLALAELRGLRGAVDQSRAARLYKRACDADTVNACSNLAVMLEDAPALLGTPPPVSATELYKRACDGGYDPACMRLDILGHVVTPLARP